MATLKAAAVLDTNVVVKMFFEEDDSERADILLKRFERGALKIFVPDFLPVEFVNVLWLRVREKLSTRSECEAALEDFLTILKGMHVVAPTPLLGAMLATSIELDHAVYDAAFIVLADNLGVQFITADAKRYRKLLSRSPSAVLLRDLEIAES